MGSWMHMCSAILMNEKVDSYGGKSLSLIKKSLSLLPVAPKGLLENKGEQHDKYVLENHSGGVQ